MLHLDFRSPPQSAHSPKSFGYAFVSCDLWVHVQPHRLLLPCLYFGQESSRHITCLWEGIFVLCSRWIEGIEFSHNVQSLCLLSLSASQVATFSYWAGRIQKLVAWSAIVSSFSQLNLLFQADIPEQCRWVATNRFTSRQYKSPSALLMTCRKLSRPLLNCQAVRQSSKFIIQLFLIHQ